MFSVNALPLVRRWKGVGSNAALWLSPTCCWLCSWLWTDQLLAESSSSSATCRGAASAGLAGAGGAFGGAAIGAGAGAGIQVCQGPAGGSCGGGAFTGGAGGLGGLGALSK